ncbi:MAG: hypothetical protein WCX22_04345 [Methanoregula sp.]
MNLQKKGVVLLALLLAAMAMVPMVSAADTSGGVNEKQKNSVHDPVNENFYLALGLEKPEKIQGPPVTSYKESKDKIDKILEMSGIQDNKENIIGLIDYEGSEILLIDRNETVIEIIRDNSTITQQVIEPVVLGEKEFKTDSVFVSESQEAITGARKGATISRIDVTFPTKSGNKNIKSLQSITVWREDWWDYLGELNLLHTQGRFYVDIGVEVDSVIDQSYAQTAGPCDRCDFTHYSSGAGSSEGQVTTSGLWATIWTPTIKMSQDAWVSCDLNGDEDGNGHGDKWGAIGIGCLAVP